MTGPIREPWEQPGYSDIIAAARTTDGVEVRFANGDVVTVSAGLLGVPNADFSVQTNNEDTTCVRIISGTAERDVDWTAIRAASDRAFASELRERDAEESRRVGRRLKALREDRDFSQRDLAQLVGMTAPQLSKLEVGSTDMRLSTVRSLLRAMGASFADISDPDAPEFSVKELGRRAKRGGAPADVIKRIAESVAPDQFVAVLMRAFDWTREALYGDRLQPPLLTEAVQFKSARPKPHDSPHLPLARTISVISASLHRGAIGNVPEDPQELRRQLLERSGEVTLESLLAWAWSTGILVVPLVGSGGFSAAAWSVGGRPVVVLKESRDLVAYWLFDLAHELGHLGRGHLAVAGVVDLSSPTSPDASDLQEREANAYALDLLLPGHQKLIAAVRKETAGSHLLFKGAVASVASAADVSPGLLGVVAAFEMSEVGEYKDRWGSAQNLGKPEGSGRSVAERHFLSNMPLHELPEIDATLVRIVALSS